MQRLEKQQTQLDKLLDLVKNTDEELIISKQYYSNTA